MTFKLLCSTINHVSICVASVVLCREHTVAFSELFCLEVVTH